MMETRSNRRTDVQKKTQRLSATTEKRCAKSITDGEFNLPANADYFFSTYMADRKLTQKGKDVTLKILEAARSILVEKGYGSLTLREVARTAGVRLSNLQYYYSTRERLIEDLLPLVFSIYHQRYNQISFSETLSPREKLSTMAQYLLTNVREPSINKLFLELWALSRRNEYVAKLLSGMYEKYCQRLEEIIAEVSPSMPAEKRKERGVLIAFLIEGIMVHVNITPLRKSQSAAIDRECIKQIQQMAQWP
ncbi:TetR/AcrR family transcriptional regulator [Hyphomicrobium sp.]|uniref:TetR/AcrR family transcriptional regulator n=1 Tax=Hyphomicrobium sp. TaxID=82 RepID=UPI002FDD7F58